MTKKKTAKDSAPQQTAQATGQAAGAVDTNASIAGAGAEAPANDTFRGHVATTEAAETIAAASGTAALASTLAAAEFITVSFPLPAGIPDVMLQAASIVVKAKSPRGRWRAGRQFTREETAIPYPDLSADQILALTGDTELVVTVRLPRPG
jgi:hypothetical protein